MTDPRQGPLFEALIPAATGDARTAAAPHRFHGVRVREWAPCVRQAADRGEVPGPARRDTAVRAAEAGATTARARVTAARAGVYVTVRRRKPWKESPKGAPLLSPPRVPSPAACGSAA
ncbi:hypothetical protein ACIQNT_11010 [Streptomyces luteogriseus]|uniref:hypothetical protein n=1 Tax=Streptomyces luteogriseus TaxID=68233 RepID=UPI00381FF5B7